MFFADKSFIVMLEAQAELASAASETIWMSLRNQALCHRGGYRHIDRIRRRLRRFERELTRRLTRTLITPLDAEDIRNLSVRLSRILDCLANAAWEQSVLSPTEPPAALIEMYETVYTSVKKLRLVLSSLPRGVGLADLAIDFRERLRQVKEIERVSVSLLLAMPGDTAEILQWKRVYERPESIIHHFVQIVTYLQHTRLKNN